MSVQATTWVWTQSKAEDNTLLVALAIADAANAQGAESCQSVKTIGRMTRASETTVHRAIRWLLDNGEIQYVGTNPRYGNTRVYQFPALWPGGPPVPAIQGGADMAGGTTGDTGGVSSETPRGAVGGTQPQRTPQGTNPTSSSDDDGEGEDQPKSTGPGVDALFTDWWTYYPKKVSKKDAKAAFEKALKRTTFEVIRAGLVASIKTWRIEGRVVVEGVGDALTVRLAAGTPEARELAKGVPHAATWLNKDRWEDEHDAAPAVAETNGGGNSWMHRTPDNTI